jgi:hypothetical protein
MESRQKLASKPDIGRTFLVAHEELFNVMKRFERDMKRAEHEYREEAAAIRSKLGVPAVYSETVDVERYSLAIQVFGAATIEATISFYAVLRFGGENHDEHFRWDAALKRLESIFSHAGIEASGTSEILELVRRVFDHRHRIVHPYSGEMIRVGEITKQIPDRPFADESAAAARRTVKDVERFFQLLRDLDPEYGHHFYVFG